MEDLRQYVEGILGRKVRDRVTNFEGVVTGVNFDLPGCIQVDVRPQGLDKDGKVQSGFWFDYNRVFVLDKNPVMELPTFAPSNLNNLKREEPTYSRGGMDKTSTKA